MLSDILSKIGKNKDSDEDSTECTNSTESTEDKDSTYSFSKDLIISGDLKDFAEIEIERIRNLDLEEIGVVYKILNLNFDCTKEEISKAYRIRAKHLHPDVCSIQGSREIFDAVTQAYQTLSDEESRRVYDKYDAVGSDQIQDIINEVCNEFVSAVNQIEDLDRFNPFDVLEQSYYEHINNKKKEKGTRQKDLKKIDKIKKKLRKKSNKSKHVKNDFLIQRMDLEKDKVNRNIRDIDKDIKKTRFKLELIENYEFIRETAEDRGMYQSGYGTNYPFKYGVDFGGNRW